MIEVTNLTKRYGANVAVDNISFTVNQGEILGFLGPNGAGKTTTMNVLTGYLSATSGDCFIYGANILQEPEKAKANVGYLPENPPLYNDLTVYEYLGFVADIKKIKRSERKKTVEALMRTVKITEMSNRLCKNLSKGYRQRLGLAQAMMGAPGALILDEPTVGLDPKQINDMREVIKGLRKKHTVILSSHILTEVSAVCDRVMIINKGKIVASDTTEALSRKSPEKRLSLRVKANADDAARALGRIDGIEIKREVAREDGSADLTIVSPADIREEIFRVLSENNMPILMLKPREASLEDIFLRLTSAQGGDMP